MQSFEKSEFEKERTESEKTCMANIDGQFDFDIAFPALKGPADDSGVVRSMISAIERKSDSGSSSGGIGALEQRKTVGMGRIIGAVGSGGRNGLIGDKGGSVEGFVDGHGHGHGHEQIVGSSSLPGNVASDALARDIHRITNDDFDHGSVDHGVVRDVYDITP